MNIYDFGDHLKGDYWPGINKISLNINGVPVNLSAASVRMQLKPNLTSPAAMTFSTANSGITITNALSGEIRINGTVIDIPAKTYIYDLEYTIPSIKPNFVKTYLKGCFKILQDVTS